MRAEPSYTDISQISSQTFQQSNSWTFWLSRNILTRWLGYYSIYNPAPSLFSFCWIAVFVSFLSFFRRKAGRIIYAVSYYVFATYSVVQYVYYLVFDRLLFLDDLKLASEGMDYTSYIINILNITVIVQICLLFLIGIIGILIYPDFGDKQKKGIIGRFIAAALSTACMFGIPQLYALNSNEIVNAEYEYETFTSSGFDLEIAGFYQFLARDAWITYLKPKKDVKELIQTVNSVLQDKNLHNDNEMTGFLECKNVILVQLETIDDWMLNEEDTPNISRMINEGVYFSEMYTPCFGTGWTFGTEFAFNTGVYQGATVYSGERLARNHFPIGLGNLALSKGYVCNSLHENFGSYYSRSSMHSVLGYSYHCSRDYLQKTDNPLDDCTLVENDECWEILTAKKPFFSFIITMSAHLPYDYNDSTVQYALSKYDDIQSDISDEVSNLRLKARLTDEMFGKMLDRLKEDGLLKDTVIIAYADHYSYGLSDKNKLKELSEAEGSTILERTPAFIWYDGCSSKNIDKICQTIDWLPTIANMLNVDIFNKVLGNDIFDPEYVGSAIFPDNTWIVDSIHCNNGRVTSSENYSVEKIDSVSQSVRNIYNANQAILESDYYMNIGN